MYFNTEQQQSQDFFYKLRNEEFRKDLHSKMKTYLSKAFIENYAFPEQRIIRFESCGDTLIQDGDKLAGANFCRNRLCPVCAYHRSVKCYAETQSIIAYLKDKNYKYLFMTLTIDNVKNLNKGVNDCIQGFYQLQHQRRFKKAFKGCMRTLEISYNEQKKTFHPHIHAIMAVEENYFYDEKTYISQDKLCNMWKTACNLDYKPICDIRLIKGNQDKAIAEVSKYAVKPLEVMECETTEKTYIDLYNATYNRRLRAEIGCFKKAKQAIKQIAKDSIEKEELSKDSKTWIYTNGKYKQLNKEKTK